jgi:putative transposase
MPRTARALIGGICYHAINRGNRKARVFHDPDDYAAFLGLIDRAERRVPMRILAYCLMPNHFHFVLRPFGDGDLSRWMHWLLTAHVRRYHRRYGTNGRIWQGRFKAFPIQQDEHLLTVMRYVERNPVRANLVARAEDWRWSSLRLRAGDAAAGFLTPSPVALLLDWTRFVNEPLTAAELRSLRKSSNKERPYGSSGWVQSTAVRLGFGLNDRGRPRLT